MVCGWCKASLPCTAVCWHVTLPMIECDSPAGQPHTLYLVHSLHRVLHSTSRTASREPETSAHRLHSSKPVADLQQSLSDSYLFHLDVRPIGKQLSSRVAIPAALKKSHRLGDKKLPACGTC